MANQPYDLQDIQNRIHTLVDNDADTPESTDDEWLTRLNLINQSIGKWEDQDVEWDELWANYTHSSVVGVGDTDYTLTATDFRNPGGYVKLTLNGATRFVPVISVEEFQTYSNSAFVCYFTGNSADGWVLNFGWSPTAGDGTVGATISFPYYKYATKFTSSSETTAKTEMRFPNFIIYDVAAAKSLLESRNNQFSIYSAEAQNILDKAKIRNAMKPNFQNDRIQDTDAINFSSIMGE